MPSREIEAIHGKWSMTDHCAHGRGISTGPMLVTLIFGRLFMCGFLCSGFGFFGGSWAFVFIASLRFLLLCFPCFSASCFCASVPFYFYYVTLSFLQSCVLLLYFMLLCSSASLLPVFTAFLFFMLFCFILSCLYPKWNPRETLGEIQINPKEILIRNLAWNPKWTLKKPSMKPWRNLTWNPTWHPEETPDDTRNPKWNPKETPNETLKKP